MEKVTEATWRSIHTDYIQFAHCSYLAAKSDKQPPGAHIFLDKNVIDTIRYSFDSLEASTVFVYHMGLNKQLPIQPEDNWLARYMRRTWRALSLAERLGMLVFAWTGKSFWKSSEEFQLFIDLKRVRNGLTHPIPYGTEIEKEILYEEELENGLISTKARHIGDPKELTPNWLTSTKAVACFQNDPIKMTIADAEKALEIMLLHLVRLEDIFFRGSDAWFSIWAEQIKEIASAQQILESIGRHFNDYWE